MITPTTPRLGTNSAEAPALLPFRTPINYSLALGTQPIAFFGERHEQPAIINEMAALTGTLRGLGFTHIAFEHFSSAEQALLDQLRNRTVSWTAAAQRLQEGIRPYLKIVDAAYQSGLRVVGIHLPAEAPYYEHISNAELNRRFKFDRYQEALLAGATDDPYLALRFVGNCYAVKILAPIFASGRARVAVLGGANHYMYSPMPVYQETTLNHLVQTVLGLSGVIVYLVSTELTTILKNPDIYSSPLMVSIPAALRALGYSGERFMIDTRERVAGDRPDFIIHVGNS